LDDLMMEVGRQEVASLYRMFSTAFDAAG
jgi:hypothetical protein